jgi:hypothetical protein
MWQYTVTTVHCLLSKILLEETKGRISTGILYHIYEKSRMKCVLPTKPFTFVAFTMNLMKPAKGSLHLQHNITLKEPKSLLKPVIQCGTSVHMESSFHGMNLYLSVFSSKVYRNT